jgi:hypothetical protein
MSNPFIMNQLNNYNHEQNETSGQALVSSTSHLTNQILDPKNCESTENLQKQLNSDESNPERFSKQKRHSVPVSKN